MEGMDPMLTAGTNMEDAVRAYVDVCRATGVQEPPGAYGDGPANPILDKTFLFSLRVIPFSKVLRTAGWPDLARQLFRAGTAPGAYVNEAQHPESAADFIHKIKGALKEISEALYWLRLCQRSPDLPYQEGLIEDAIEIRRILKSILWTAVKNRDAK